MQIIPGKKASHRRALTGVLVIVVLGGCSSGPSSSEVERVAQEKVEQYLTRCGDSYIGAKVEADGQLQIHQWGPAEVNINAEELTEGDKADGIEWKGTVQVGSAVLRKEHDRTVVIPALEIHCPQGWLVKEDGKWELFRFANNKTLRGVQLTGGELKKVECSALPQ